jgi:Ca2+-binding RTX toxin-like protein
MATYDLSQTELSDLISGTELFAEEELTSIVNAISSTSVFANNTTAGQDARTQALLFGEEAADDAEVLVFGGEPVETITDIGNAKSVVFATEADVEAELGGSGARSVASAGGDDQITMTGSSSDFIVSGGGDDIVSAGRGSDTVFGAEGDDSISGGAGEDSLDGGEGDDTLLGEQGEDTIRGGEGDDELDGGTGADELDGGEGDDVVLGGSGADTLDGGEGDDTLLGGSGNDEIYGGLGDDSMVGGVGNDSFYYEGGADTVVGGAGSDTLDILEYSQADVASISVQGGVTTIVFADGESIAYSGIETINFKDQI